MTLGVHDDLWALMRTRYAGRTAVTQAVRSELNRLRRSHQTAVAKLAKRAALDTSWQGPGVLLNSDEERTAVESLRGKISAGRPGHPNAWSVTPAGEKVASLLADDEAHKNRR